MNKGEDAHNSTSDSASDVRGEVVTGIHDDGAQKKMKTEMKVKLKQMSTSASTGNVKIRLTIRRRLRLILRLSFGIKLS